MKKSYKKCLLGLCILLAFSTPIMAEESEKKLVPVGQAIGVTLDLGGIEVVDVVSFYDYDDKKHSPALDAGINVGDSILEINSKEVEDVKSFKEVLNHNGDKEIAILIRRNGENKEVRMTPAISNTDGKFSIGVWIKDAASGIGTLTYYDPETMKFGALGHGITDPKSGKPMDISGGDILCSTIVAIQKGSKGQPGELIGVFADGKEKIGQITDNSENGICGTIKDKTKVNVTSEAIPVANRNEVTEGKAYILSNINENRIEQFEIQIQKINKCENSSKGMVIKITDEKLLEQTGGIVQGMSGSPIIQNGKLVGAITHVFVNEPTRGYGIF
ncbi:MAG: SpoIVB peptidase, partial [Oscillospiraceae bacterium]